MLEKCKTDTVVNLGGRAVTYSQTTEIWQKKPDLMKMVTVDQDGKKREVVSDGQYMYVKNQGTGKWMSLKSGAMPDPFAYVGSNLDGFGSSSVVKRDGRIVVVLSGGKDAKGVDRIEATMDEEGKRVKRIEGFGTDGSRQSEIVITYKDDGSITTVDTKADSGGGKVDSHFEIVTDEKDLDMPADLFKTN